ncbi:LytR/AlgR family response regulator transcription factor [Thalassomonas sp. M1454]|uniref:LytR/AlgR family response regulator transcription factor n=1 Tax=Thalassomonas sp. M1454 TaxID=2594477 RepID=UPI00117E3F4C|nr:response regulator [Thalassomonas sp. M1454]TRX56815.1 response regulator [Thalassomonas sp. M1454]
MNSTLSTIIVDDEALARKGLQVRLTDFDDINVVATCSNGSEAIASISQLQPDLVFLDIQMPGLNGFQVVEELSSLGCNMPQIVFVTAFDQYAIKAFDIHAIDYLLKPVDSARLGLAIEKVKHYKEHAKDSLHKEKLVKLVSEVTGNDTTDILEQLANNTPVSMSSYSDVLAIKDVGETSLVPTKDILCIDAAGDYMCVHTSSGTHILRKTMKELEEALDPKLFLRIHRSSIVNKTYIDKFGNHANGEYYIILTNDKELKVSRSYKDKVKQAILG